MVQSTSRRLLPSDLFLQTAQSIDNPPTAISTDPHTHSDFLVSKGRRETSCDWLFSCACVSSRTVSGILASIKSEMHLGKERLYYRGSWLGLANYQTPY